MSDLSGFVQKLIRENKDDFVLYSDNQATLSKGNTRTLISLWQDTVFVSMSIKYPTYELNSRSIKSVPLEDKRSFHASRYSALGRAFRDLLIYLENKRKEENKEINQEFIERYEQAMDPVTPNEPEDSGNE